MAKLFPFSHVDHAIQINIFIPLAKRREKLVHFTPAVISTPANENSQLSIVEKKKQGDFCLNTESLSFLDHLARGYFCSNIGQFSFHYWSNFGTIFDLFVIFQRFFNFHQILTSWQLFVHPLLKKGNYFHSCVELLF